MAKYTRIFIGVVFVVFGLTACNKGCDFPEDENLGTIIPDAIVYGGNTGGVASVHHDSTITYDFKVSFDNGFTYVPVDWSKYSILNFPIVSSCNTHFTRETTVNSAIQTLTYKVTVESCPDCEEEYRTENWVLVKKFPANYAVKYEKKVK